VERQVVLFWRLSGYAADQRYQQPTDDTYARWYKARCNKGHQRHRADTGLLQPEPIPSERRPAWTKSRSASLQTATRSLTRGRPHAFAGNHYCPNHRQEISPTKPPTGCSRVSCADGRAGASPVTLWAPVQDLTPEQHGRPDRLQRASRISGIRRFSLDTSACPARELRSSQAGVGIRPGRH